MITAEVVLVTWIIITLPSDPDNEFSETGIDGAKALRDCIQLFATIDEIKQKIQEVQQANLHKNNDLLIYQIISDHPDNFVSLNTVQIIKAT